MTDITFQCDCGTLRGVVRGVSPKRGVHLACMCDDCQTAAHALGRADWLDAHGGTHVYQTYPSQVQLTDGTEQLECMRLSPKGLHRWYAGCCKTPIANTLGKPGVPFVGVMRRPMGDSAETVAALGPLRMAIQGRWAIGGLPPKGHLKAPLGLILRSVRLLAWGVVSGKSRPSAFFVDGRPVVSPQVLPLEQRNAAKLLSGP